MKQIYVSGLEPNEVVTTSFLVVQKEIRQKKTGEHYLSLILADRTGEVEAKMWDNVTEVMETFEKDDFIKVKGVAQLYQNRPQFTIHKLRRLDESEADSADFFPCSARDPEEMFTELRATIAGMSNPHLRALLEAIFADPAIAEPYKLAPAAKTIHHAWRSGLIEHVLSLCALCRLAAGHYGKVDIDLLLTGAILHDIGKIEELTFDRSFSYSSSGQLLGHIVIGLRIVDEKLRLVPGFPPKLRLLVEHMLISHHGELEFGSPKVPVFLEALLLHHLDNLDSKVEAMRAAVERDRMTEGDFTSWVHALERVVLKKDKFLSAPDHTDAPAVQSAPSPAGNASPAPAKGSSKPDVHTAPMSDFGSKLQSVLNLEK
jgi:3'-5' exoribonuclease